MLIFRSKYIFFAILNFKIFIYFGRILKELLMKQLELFSLTTFIPWNLWKVLQQHFTVATFYPEFSDESDLQFFKVWGKSQLRLRLITITKTFLEIYSCYRIVFLIVVKANNVIYMLGTTLL